MKINLPNSKRKKVSAISKSTVNPVHKIPGLDGDGEGEEIDLSHLHGWDELTVQKQRYLVSFSENNMKEKRAALAIGISSTDVTEWLESDGIFNRIYHDIIDIHVEGVEEVEYVASYGSASSRGRFLKHQSNKYKKDPEEQPVVPRIGVQNNQTNILAVLNDPNVKQEGLAGVQKAFNQMKQQGQIPQEIKEEKK